MTPVPTLSEIRNFLEVILMRKRCVNRTPAILYASRVTTDRILYNPDATEASQGESKKLALLLTLRGGSSAT